MTYASPGGVPLACVEIALARAGARLRVALRGDEYIATIERGGDEFVFAAESFTDAIYYACELASISILSEPQAAA